MLNIILHFSIRRHSLSFELFDIAK